MSSETTERGCVTEALDHVLFALFLNVFSSVGVIFVNKLVFNSAHFNFATTLTIFHFIFCFILCVLAAKGGGLFPLKRLGIAAVFPISVAFCGYVVFNNLSLSYNSVAFYQTSKLLCTPVIVFVEHVFHDKRRPFYVLITILPTMLGVYMVVRGETQLNFWGFIWATLAIIANSMYTVWGKTKQQELDATPMQLLVYQAPLSAGMLVFALPFFDNWRGLLQFHMTGYALTTILLSCVLAFGVNFSFFLFVGKTSPLSTNMLGYLKTCFVYVGSFLLMREAVNISKVLGICICFFGLVWYTKANEMHNKEKQKQAEAPPAATTTTDTSEPEDSLLADVEKGSEPERT